MYKLYSKNEITASSDFLTNSIIEFFIKPQGDIKSFCFFEDKCYYLVQDSLFESSFFIENEEKAPFGSSLIFRNVSSVCATLNGVCIQFLNGEVFLINPGGFFQKKTKFKTMGNFYYSKNKASFIFFDKVRFVFSSPDFYQAADIESASTNTYWSPIDILGELIWYGYNKISNMLYVYNNKTLFSYPLRDSSFGAFPAVINEKSFIAVLDKYLDTSTVRCSLIQVDQLMSCEPRFVFIPQGGVMSSDNTRVLDSANPYAVINSIKIVKISDDYVLKAG